MLDSDLRRWVVCERAGRWIHAIRRFGPEMIAAPLILEVVAAEAPAVPNLLRPSQPSIVLWEAASDSLLETCQRVKHTANAFPMTLHVVADSGLSDDERTVLCEFPVAVIVQQPEQLPRLRPLVQGHFATSP